MYSLFCLVVPIENITYQFKLILMLNNYMYFSLNILNLLMTIKLNYNRTFFSLLTFLKNKIK